MEKFSKWRDASTGIQPFLTPMPSRTNANIYAKIAFMLGIILKPILGILKLLLTFVTAILLFLLVDIIGLALKNFKSVYRTYHYIFTSLLSRLSLFFMGFYWIRVETVSLRKGRPSIPKLRQISGVRPGDVIICNWTSYVEVLYLAFRFDPIFTQVYPSSNTLRPISLWTALWLTGSYPEDKPPSSVKTYSLQELVREATINKLGPIVVFPEGTTSNGRALLKIAPTFKSLSLPIEAFSIHILTARYEYDNFSPTYTVGNKFWHFVMLCSQYFNVLHVKILAPEESLSSPNFAIPSAQSSVLPSPSIIQDDVIGSQILNLMGQLGRMRKTNLGMEDKKAFLDFYWEKTSGYAKKK
ncbi:hypothetical protein C2G38_2117399 [Gigaspora rosea]|uniref:Phospholipid/glycerol acyltransferase domain-containing protein n=1 Tax=Gigaspora rosea TaxID=44941 RepID=A0A397UFG6_9GLOM|nr:hypothetical protein C2G38_2117399 [Gigaspora rosea]